MMVRMASKNTDELLTKSVLDKSLNEFADVILAGMDKIIVETRNGFGSVNTRLTKVESRLENVEADIAFIKDDIKGIKADLSDTPSRTEFNQLKNKVDKYISS